MPHNDRISQRRLQCLNQACSHSGAMASTDSEDPQKVDGMPPERVVGMDRNGWTASIGIAGRRESDYAVYHPWCEPTMDSQFAPWKVWRPSSLTYFLF